MLNKRMMEQAAEFRARQQQRKPKNPRRESDLITGLREEQDQTNVPRTPPSSTDVRDASAGGPDER